MSRWTLCNGEQGGAGQKERKEEEEKKKRRERRKEQKGGRRSKKIKRRSKTKKEEEKESDQEEGESETLVFSMMMMRMMMKNSGGSRHPTGARSEGSVDRKWRAESHQHAASKQRELGGVGVKTDLVLSRSVGGEGEATFRTVLTRQDHLGGGSSINHTLLLHHMTKALHLLRSTCGSCSPSHQGP